MGPPIDLHAAVNIDVAGRDRDGAAQGFGCVMLELDATSVCFEVDHDRSTQDDEVAAFDNSLLGYESAPYDGNGTAINASSHKDRGAMQDDDDVACGSAAHDGHGSNQEKNGATRSGSVHESPVGNADAPKGCMERIFGRG